MNAEEFLDEEVKKDIELITKDAGDMAELCGYDRIQYAKYSGDLVLLIYMKYVHPLKKVIKEHAIEK